MEYGIARARQAERRELMKRGAARMAAVLAIVLPMLVGAGGGVAQQPMDGADLKMIDALLAQAQQAAAAADGTAAGAGIFFASAQDECRTAFEIEWQQRAARRDGIIEADMGAGPKRMMTPPPPHPPGFVTFVALPRRGPAHYQLERIATCLRALSWGLGAPQLFNLKILRGLETELRAVRRELAELKRERER